MAASAEIRTKRLLITPFREKHLQQHHVDWLNDPDVVRFSEQRHRNHTIESCRTYWKSFNDSPNFFWAIEEVEEKFGHIGNINAFVDRNNLLADVGILIGEKKFWGRGYGFEAFNAVCRFLFQDSRIRKIGAGTLENNTGMLKILKRMNMIKDGRRIRHFLFDSKEIDLMHMALFRNQLKSLE